MIQQSYSWAHIQREPYFEKVRAPLRSQQHCSQGTRHGNQLNVHLADEWLRQTWSIYTMECHSAIERRREATRRFPGGAGGKEPMCQCRSLIPGSGRSLGGGHGNPPQCSCLENPMARGAWWATVHEVAKTKNSTHAGRVKTSPSNTEGVGLIPGLEAKIS